MTASDRTAPGRSDSNSVDLDASADDTAGQAPGCLSLRPDPLMLEVYRSQLGLDGPEQALQALALALLSSEDNRHHQSLHAVTRAEPQPVVALVDVADLSQSQPDALLARAALYACGSLQYVDYALAEDVCVRLAEVLSRLLGEKRIAASRFAAVPRGGGFVLNMLAYLLQLDGDQIGAPVNGRTTVVVDDAAFTGQRLREYLSRLPPESDIVVATLYSHPDLRSAIQEAETRVQAFVSGADLPDRHPTDARTFAAWQRQHGKHTYGITIPSDHLCFAWKEPRRFVWDPQLERLRRCWRVLPPSRCLETRALHAALQPRLHHLPRTPGPLRPADAVVSLVTGGNLTIVDTCGGTTYRLSGTGLDVWTEVLKLGERQAVIDEIARTHDIDYSTVRRQLHALIDELCAKSLLCEA